MLNVQARAGNRELSKLSNEEAEIFVKIDCLLTISLNILWGPTKHGLEPDALSAALRARFELGKPEPGQAHNTPGPAHHRKPCLGG
jgi:hypothetical protein